MPVVAPADKRFVVHGKLDPGPNLGSTEKPLEDSTMVFTARRSNPKVKISGLAILLWWTVAAGAAWAAEMDRPLVEFASPSALVDPPPLEQMHTELDLHLRLAPEAELRFGGLALGGQFYLGLFDEVSGGQTYRPGMLGGLVYASFFFLQRYEVALRWANVTLLKALRDDARTEKPEAEHEINLGFNIYLFGTTMKWQIDLGLLIHELPPSPLLDARLRTQLQLAF